jgi:serine/threonine protein phosphatase PrpC
MNYGLIGKLNMSKRYGVVNAADGTSLTFLFDDCQEVGANFLKQWQPVEFDVVVHPWEADRLVAKNVRVLPPLPKHSAKVTLLRDGYGFLRLKNGEGAFFFTNMIPGLVIGDTVECIVVPGRDKHLFTLSISKTVQLPNVPAHNIQVDTGLKLTNQPTVGLDAETASHKVLAVGVATRTGTRHGKDVNDDAFLAHPILNGDGWLFVIADGISHPENGWWASDKCMELIWRSVLDMEQRLVQEKGKELQVVSEWLYKLNRDFLRERGNCPSEFQQSSSTLTLAIVKGCDVYCATCGDSRLFILDPKKETRFSLKGAFTDELSTQRVVTGYHRAGLSSHIAAKGGDWNPLSSHLRVPEAGILLLCSDGVIARDRELKWSKSSELKKLLASGDDLQSAVTGVLERIQAAGETDDLTLIAFRPMG